LTACAAKGGSTHLAARGRGEKAVHTPLAVKLGVFTHEEGAPAFVYGFLVWSLAHWFALLVF
jgi:hypothetical protein